VFKKIKKLIPNREYRFFGTAYNPKKPHNPYWARASEKLYPVDLTVTSLNWKFSTIFLKFFRGLLEVQKPHNRYWEGTSGRLVNLLTCSQKLEKLGRKLEACSKIIPECPNIKLSRAIWKFFVIVNLKPSRDIFEFQKPQKLCRVRGLRRFGRFGITLAKIQRLVQTLPKNGTRIRTWVCQSDRSQKVRIKSKLKSSQVNRLVLWMLFRGELFVGKYQKLYNPCWEQVWHRLWEFSSQPPSLERSLAGRLRNFPVPGIFGGGEVGA